jgi:hypothetical protein
MSDNIDNYFLEEKIAKLRWLQVKELRIKYPNDQDFGHEVAKLIMKQNNEKIKYVSRIRI